MTKATKYRIQHAMIKIYNNVTFVIKLLVVEKTFEKILDHGSENNGKSTNMDLFWKEMIVLVKGIFLQNYT